MARLPTPGSDNGTWGSILNDYLNVSHKSDGTLKPVGTADLTDSAITSAKLADNSITSAKIVDGTIVDDDINASAAINLSKLATDPLARSNHTGTQTMATISDAGDSATKNVGTTAGTVAAGDDSRITGAVPSSDIIDEDDMVSNSATKIPTQQSVKAYVDAGVNSSNVLLPSTYVAGYRTYATAGWRYGDTVSYWNYVANRWFYEPRILEGEWAVTWMMVNAQSAAAPGSKAIFAIYEADANWQPGALVAQSAEFAVDSTGEKLIAISATGSTGRYLFAITSDGDFNVYFRSGWGPIGPRYAFSVSDSYQVMRRGPATYSATAPSSGVAWDETAANWYDFVTIMAIVEAQ